MHWVITVNTNTKYLTVPIVNMIKIARYSYKEYLCFLIDTVVFLEDTQYKDQKNGFVELIYQVFDLTIFRKNLSNV